MKAMQCTRSGLSPGVTMPIWGACAVTLGHSDIWAQEVAEDYLTTAGVYTNAHGPGYYDTPLPIVTTGRMWPRVDHVLNHVLNHELKYKGLAELAPPLIGPGRADPVPRRPWNNEPQLPWHEKAGRAAAPPPTLTPHLGKLFLPPPTGPGDRRIQGFSDKPVLPTWQAPGSGRPFLKNEMESSQWRSLMLSAPRAHPHTHTFTDTEHTNK